VSKLRDVGPPALVEGSRCGRRHHEIVVLSIIAVYGAVAVMTRFRVLEALEGDRERDRRKVRENLDPSDNQAHNLLQC
jgi:hypothetical protein